MNRSRGLTRTGRTVLLGAIPLASLAVLTSDTWLYLLAAAFLGAVGADALAIRHGCRSVEVAVELPARTHAGETVGCRVSVRNAARWTAPELTVTHVSRGLADLVVLVPALAAGSTASQVLPRYADRRAAPRTSTVELTASGPFGLARASRTTTLPGRVAVHPAPVPASMPPEGGGSAGSASVPDRSGLDVRGIREYRPGDSTREVHWRSTARRGRLVVLEREVPRGSAVTVLVAGRASDPGWEAVVAEAASTAALGLRAGRPVALLAAQPDLPATTPTDEVALLDWFAALEDPTLPDVTVTARAASREGSGGVLLLAATWVPDPWWYALAAAARAHQVELHPLTARTDRPS